jgi:CarD family transcriptional regulator
MKTSGTAARARHGHAIKAVPAKPAAKSPAASRAITEAEKALSKPAARAAAAAVATKSEPLPKRTNAATKPVETAKARTAGRSEGSSKLPASAEVPSTAVSVAPEQPVCGAAKPELPAARPAAVAKVVKAQAIKVAEDGLGASAPGEPGVSPEAEPSAQTAGQSAGDTRRGGPPGMHGGPIMPPRIPAKAEVFQEGDHVVYPTHGVGKVERIAIEEIAGHKLELIHITFEENRMTLRVPVAKARTAGLRKLATRKLFEEALNVLRGRARIKRTMWSRRAQEYEAKINSGDPLAIAEVVRDLHRNAGQPDQSFSERQIYEAAMDRLAAELAALDKTDKTTAANKLTEFLKTV